LEANRQPNPLEPWVNQTSKRIPSNYSNKKIKKKRSLHGTDEEYERELEQEVKEEVVIEVPKMHSNQELD